MKRNIILLTLLFSGASFSEDMIEVNEKLQSINNKKIEIEKLIEGGKNPELFEEKLENLLEQETILLSKRIKKEKKKIRGARKKRFRPKSKKSVKKTTFAINRKRSIEGQLDAVLELIVKERTKIEAMEESIKNGVDKSYFLTPMRRSRWQMRSLKKEKGRLERKIKESLTQMRKEGKLIEIHGQARVRGESKNNADFVDLERDRLEFIASRFRLNFLARTEKSTKWNVFLQPQFTKIWGKTEFNPTSATVNTENKTSSNLYDTRLDIHQAHINYHPTRNLSFKVGRQEIIYGDHLLVGSVGWHNTARSFDALKIRLKNTRGKTDIFYSKVKDQNISSAGNGDFDFSGIYNTLKVSNKLKEFDLYVFSKNDHTQVDRSLDSTLYSFGTRLKSKIDRFDYRGEGTIQKGRALGVKREGEFQYDIELGYTFNWLKTRFAMEYFMASKNYDQLFPTAHKWLGYADQFKRQNIKGLVFHLKSAPTQSLILKMDYHLFQRKDVETPAKSFSGSSLGTGSENNSSEVASELDLTAKYHLEGGLSLTFGHSIVFPKAYLKQTATATGNKRNKKTKFSYLQLLANF